jgi:hypothetical protein
MSSQAGALGVSKKTGVYYDPVFLKILEDIPGGATVKMANIPTNVYELRAGTLLQEDATTAGLFNPIKTAKSTSTQTAATSITVEQTDPDKVLFKVGEYIAVVGKTTGSTITVITQTAGTTQTIVTGTALGTLATASVVNQVSAAGATTKLYTADSILRDTIRCRENDGTTLQNVGAGAVVRGTVDESELPYSVETADKTALTARIRFA